MQENFHKTRLHAWSIQTTPTQPPPFQKPEMEEEYRTAEVAENAE